MEKIIMDRFTRLQKIVFSGSILICIFLGYIFSGVKIPWYIVLLSVIISLGIYFALEYNPLSKIIFNHDNKNIMYYEFFVSPKIIPLSSVLNITGQTKIEHSYGGGKSKTMYITDVFIFTDNQDYQIKVFERAKLNEFISKFNKAQLTLTSHVL